MAYKSRFFRERNGGTAEASAVSPAQSGTGFKSRFFQSGAQINAVGASGLKPADLNQPEKTDLWEKKTMAAEQTDAAGGVKKLDSGTLSTKAAAGMDPGALAGGNRGIDPTSLVRGQMTSTGVRANQAMANRELENVSGQISQAEQTLLGGRATTEEMIQAQKQLEDLKEQKAALEKERDRNPALYYQLENREQQAKLQQDQTARQEYEAAKTLREDLDRIEAIGRSIGQGATDRLDKETYDTYKSYLMEKYGITQNAINAAAVSREYRDTGNGYSSLWQLYDELAAQLEEKSGELSGRGFDFNRMYGYEQRQSSQAEAQEKQEAWQKEAEEYPVLSSLGSVAVSPMQGLDYLSLLLNNLGHNSTKDLSSYEPLDTSAMDATNYVGTVRGTVGQKVQQSFDSETAGKVASFLYQTGMSVVDSAAMVAAFGPGATVFMGGSAAAGQAKDVLERGGTNRQALLSGLAAGAAEVVFEKFSVDNLLAEKSVGSLKDLLRETVKQAGVEASEEMLTEIANILSDAAIMGGMSSFAASVSAYQAEGMTQEEAKRRAYLDCVKQVALAGAGGALSGGVMGGVTNTARYGMENLGQKNTVSTEETVRTEGNAAQTPAGTQTNTQANTQTETGETQDLDAGGQETMAGRETAGPGIQEERDQAGQKAVKMPPGVTDTRGRLLTRQESEELRKIDRIARAAGVSVRIVEDLGGNEQGRYENGEIVLSGRTSDPMLQVAKHEVTHRLQEKAPEAYARYRELVEQILTERGRLEEAIQGRIEGYAEEGKTLTRETALDEAAADFTKELLLDESMFSRLAGENVSVARKVLDALKDLLTRLKRTLSGGEVQQLQQAARAWEKALRETSAQKNTDAIQDGNVKYSVKNTRKMTLAEQLKMLYGGKLRSSDALYFGETPDTLADAGLEALPLAFAQTDFKKSTKIKHNVPRRAMNRMNENLGTALLAFRDGDRVGILTGDIDGDGKPLLVGIQSGVQMGETKVNAIRSAYGLDNPGEWLKNQIESGKEFTLLDEKRANTFLLLYGYSALREEGVSYIQRADVGLQTDGTNYVTVEETNRSANESVEQNDGKVKKEFYQGGGDAPASGNSISTSEENANGKSSMAGVRELEQQLVDLKKQNERLKEKNRKLQNQMKRTDSARTDEEEVRRTAGGLLKDFSSKYDRKQLAGRLQRLYDSMADPDWENGMTEREMRQEAQSIAGDVLNEVSVLNDDLYREYSDLRQFLRTTKMKVPQELWGDLDSEGGYNEFRKRNMGRLSMSSTEGRAVEDVYQELSYEYPGLFDQDAVSNPADQLIQMAEIAGSLGKTYDNPYASDRAAVEYLAGEILERFYDLHQQKPTFADRAAARVEETRQKERTAAGERLQRELKKQADRYQRKIKNIKESNRQAGIRARENMSATKLRDTIKRHAEGLSRKLLRPTNKQHIPEYLRGSVLALLDVIDLESKYGYEFTREAEFKRVNQTGGGNLEPTKRTEAARALKAAYEELRNDPSFNASVDPDLADKLEEIAGMGDIRVADMNREQLQTVWEAVRAVETSVSKADEMLGDSRYGKISAAAEQLRTDVGDRKDRDNFVGVLGVTDRLLNLDMLTPETFLHRMGAVGEDIHRQMRRAQDRNIGILKEGIEVYRKAAKETKVDLLEAEKKLHTFELSGGNIELTTAQVMDLYALSKRKAAKEHIYTGGLRAEGGKKGLKKTGKSKPVKVTMEDVADILSVLTPEQKKLVDRMQEYMSTRLAAHGNEASMEAYGYEKFRETAYWPIKVSKNETDTDPAEETRAKTIPEFGITKALTPHANNSVVLRSALNTYAEHLNQMATYAAWLATSENVTKLLNYDFMEEGNRTGTVKDLFQKVYGDGGEKYMNNLLGDIAQGTRTGGGERPLTEGMLGRWKGAKVGANVRVILQQPTAILRAAEMIDSKYMAQAGNPMKGWKKAVEWAPIAQWKDWGYFEMDAGRSMRELMAGTKNVLDKTKNVTMAPAGFMDSVAWGMLWNSVEAETKEKHSDLQVGSNEFYQTVAERFGDIIDRTQVVDSVLHRTQIMRSENSFNRMATSFMSEPSKIYNMVARDIYDIRNAEKGSAERRRAWKHMARTGTALMASFMVNAVAQSIPDMIRDDDRDKTLAEKFTENYVENFTENFDPLGYLPYIKDIESIVMGLSVERTDLEGLADMVYAIKNLMLAATGNGSKTTLNAGMEAVYKTLDFIGLPASNIKRDVAGLISTALQLTGAHWITYQADKEMLQIGKSGNKGVFYDTLYRAMNDDYDAYAKIYADMVESGIDPKDIALAMEKRMAERAGLDSVVMLPADYSAPGENKAFDAMLQGEGWIESIDSDLIQLARELETLEPEQGASSVTNLQRQRAIADSEYDEDVKEKSMERVMGASAYDRYMAARDAGISTYDYMNLLEDIMAATMRRRGESGSASQDDVVEALKLSGLSTAQKRAVWKSYGWKSESPWG